MRRAIAIGFLALTMAAPSAACDSWSAGYSDCLRGERAQRDMERARRDYERAAREQAQAYEKQLEEQRYQIEEAEQQRSWAEQGYYDR